jgi:hypothetical protein
MFKALKIKHCLVTLLVAWVVLLSGLTTVQERFFKIDPDSGAIQDILDEAGVGASPAAVHWVRLERRLSEKPLRRDTRLPVQAPTHGVSIRPAQSVAVSGLSFHRFSRAPPVRWV